MKIDQNTCSGKIFALLDGVESDLEDEIDELINDSGTEFTLEKEGCEKDDVSDDQPRKVSDPRSKHSHY